MSAWLALWAMLLQAAFAAEHASAMAVAAAIGGPDGTSLGFLQICTADGIVTIGADGKPIPRSNDGTSCLLCGIAAVGGAVAAVAPVLGTPAAVVVAAVVPEVSDFRLATPWRRVGTTRGPPLA
ncbi:DUF2946 family protein [Rhodobium gokarnense]|uniref:DUF2946 domain-containing protein n=1 Tax=Rhodobium gokarnense TaxID=364296 RepID=A0ABT3HBZ6_9HYPH|nr:DUF2946 family protein [Rhodobium gokarnense]MCW2307929.1 hypothetical protein [Rhodobium gokarnense]